MIVLKSTRVVYSNYIRQKMRFSSASLDEVLVGFGCVLLLLLHETVRKEYRGDNHLFPNVHEEIDESFPR
jgi:hypothetical protein